jgi:putative cardiolipin synthase
MSGAAGPAGRRLQESTAIPVNADTPLGGFAHQWQAQNPGKSGILSLERGLDGLGARLKALDLAHLSVDAQYFLIKPDEAGRLFLGKLLAAADRGVRIRLLLDDIFTPRDDQVLATLATHPKIQIRLFNPLSRKSPAFWALLRSFSLTNRRMHNKSFIVDDALAIFGGRNIAAEYFGLKPNDNFNDFEVLATGPVIDELAASFDSFWKSPLSLPVEKLTRRINPQRLDRWRRIMQEVVEGVRPSAYSNAVDSEFMQELFRGERSPQAAVMRVVSDSPDKFHEAPGAEHHLVVADALVEALASARRGVTVITPYFLPRERGRLLSKAMASRGLQIRLITNSLASTNHVAVHAHYRKYRREMLEAGIEMYELRADRRPRWEQSGQQRATLHTKAFQLDGETIVLGSANLDPRSIELNSELIVFIESRKFSAQLRQFLKEGLPELTWQVRLDERQRLRWHYHGQSGAEVVTREPGASAWRRLLAGFYSLLPIERQL